MGRKSKEQKKPVIEESFSSEAEEDFVVEKVLDRRLIDFWIYPLFYFFFKYANFFNYRIKDDRVEYLLKWKGLDGNGQPWWVINNAKLKI